MRKLLLKIFDCIFPPREDAVLLRNCTEDDIVKLFHPETHDEVHTLTAYHHTYIRALVHEAKFHRNPKAQRLLAQLFVSFMKTNEAHFDYIIPIPLSAARLRARGYNQVLEILKAAPEKIPPIRTDLLQRTKDTAPQTSLKREKRLENMRDAFGVAHPTAIVGKHILIIDDVSTTGATLKAAKAALLPHKPASITLLALAH